MEGGKRKNRVSLSLVPGCLSSSHQLPPSLSHFRFPWQTQSRINKSNLLKFWQVFHRMPSFWSWGRIVKTTYCDCNKGIKMKLEESLSLESSTKRLARKKKAKNIPPKQIWHWAFAAVKTKLCLSDPLSVSASQSHTATANGRYCGLFINTKR